MFSKNNIKMNDKKQAEKINQYGIKKFNAGTASVLIASGFLFLGGAAQAAETTKQETPVETTANDKTTEKVETPKAEVAEKTAEKTVESTVVKTSAVKTKLQEKINRLNDLFVTLAGRELSETQQKLTVDAAIELNKAKDLIVDENATQAQVNAQTVTLENSISFLNKSLEAKKVEDKKVEDKKAEDKKEVKETKSAKEELEKTISEAKVINQTATAFAEKSVKEESKKAEIKAAVAIAKKQIAKALGVFNSDSSTKSDSERERKELERAIEAVYATMQRAGHRGKLEGLLADAASTTVNISNPINKVVVNNVGAITDEEARAIEKEIRTANPTLTAEDKIEVKRQGNLGQPVATITLANGRVDQNGSKTHGFAISDVSYGSAGEKNYSQLREAINWFDFATASITYNDGTKVGPVEYVDNPAMVDFTSSKGRQERGRFTMVRTVLESTTHPELVGKKTNDPAFLASGLAKYTLWKTYNDVKNEVQKNQSSGRGNNEIFEVLQEGMRFDVPTKVKGYTLSATVSSLSRKKVTTETYTLNKANGEPENINRSPVDGVVQREDVIVTRQDPNWSHLRLAGFETKYEDSRGITRERLTAFAPAYDGGNVGVKFQLSATYNGRPVAVNAIAVDSEDLSVAEFTQFESDGTPWEEFMRLNKNKTNSQGLFPNRNVDHNFTYTFDRKTDTKLTTGYNLSEWANKTETGYGSQLFGPFDSGINRGYDLPIGLSQNVENLGVYINANGSQSATVGFVIYDGGDASSSYGSAQHIIGNFNSEKNGTQVVHTQPYLGDVPADSDFRTTIGEPNGAWVLDDLVNSEDYKEISLVSGTTKVTNSKGQSGTYLLDGKNPVIRMEDGTQVAIKNGEILATANTLKGGDGLPIKGLYNQATRGLGVGNLPDEGEGQLLDSRVATKYTLRRASENEYVLKGVKVNRGVNNDVAYVRGWVDFNGNGKFDLYESSELVTANADGTYDITFKNTPQLLNTSVDNLGVRLRVSVDKNDLRLPTGLASSGEVEDFVANVIHQPRGTSHVTKGLQGQKQEVNLPTNAMFTASGKTIVSNYKQWAQIDNNTAPKMVLNDTVVKSEEPTGKTVEVKDNLSQTIYNGTEVVVKDARGNTLGTAVKVTNKLTGRAEYYLSEYTEYDTAGNKVGVYKLNEGSTEGKNIQNGSLNYTKISFQPEPGYVGTAKGVAIRAWDDNGSHTGWEATEDTIRDSLTSTNLADKDKILENTNNGTNGTKTMDTSYIPTVIDVRPVGEDTTTTDSQGKKQSAKPQIPVYGTVETETGDRITDSKYSFEILNKKEKIRLADTLESKKVTYDSDTEVSKPTTITLADGKVVTYTPDKEKLPVRAKIAEDADVVVTGTGSVVLNNVRLVTGKTIPAGSSPVDPHPVTADTVVTLANGTETTIPAGGRIPTGAKLKNSLVSTANNTWNNVTYNTGDTIPRESGGKIPTLAKETSISQIVAKGDVVKIDGKYRATNTIPAGTTIKKILPLNQVVLPSATHLDPVTGAITEVPRSYDLANTNDSKVTITGEGVYELVKDSSGKPTGEVTFTPEPGFVGRGTGVDLVQPDIDYNDKVPGDPVTEKYGTDYGRAKYTPIVTPDTKASITRTIHYVYESDNDATATSQDSYKNNNPILSINNEPVTRSQTLNFNRTYKMFDEDGVLDQPMVAANTVRDVNGTQYTAGTEIPKGTKFSQGTLIISDWKHGENNEVMSSIVSPTVKGYTANVVTLGYNAPNATGEMAHIKDAKDIGAYKPVTGNTKDVGTYKPASSAIRSDDKDNFDMYVVYKADKQKANVTYIDLDATGDARILEVQTAVATPTTGADAKTTYSVEKLQGKSHTTIPYSTAETIKKYEALGYELVTDDYTNDAEGNAISGGRKFDDDKDVDQPFNVYLRHKKVLRKIKDTQEVTRTIEYKYADTDEVPADKRGKTAASTVTEKLTYERDRTIDHVLAAKEYPTQYAAYKAVADANPYGSDAEFAARKTFYDHITTKAIAADATPAQKAIVTFGPWTPKGGEATGITLSDAEKSKDDKFNLVNSPDVTGYAPDNATVEATTSIDAEAPDYKVTVTYTPAPQKAVVKFVEVDATNTNKVITPGLAEPVVVTGKSEAAYPATTATSVTDKITELVKKGYELVNNGFVSTDKFDKDAAVDQEYVVKFKAKVVDIPSFDPTKPVSNDNPKPTPGVTPIDPNNTGGPKWTEELINAIKVQEEVTRTIKYVYEDGTPVAEADLASVADKKVKTLKFTRPGKINVATGEITYGDWSANQTFEAETSPVLEKYTAAVAGVTPTTANVPEKTVAATDKDFEEVVVYKTKLITVDPKAPGYKEPKKDEPINPSDPNGPKWTDELLAKLKNTEKVTRTISYVYSEDTNKLNQAEKDGNKGGANVVKDNTEVTPFVTEVNFNRVAKVNPVTNEITYEDWKPTTPAGATAPDDTLEGKTTIPVIPGYVATGDVEASKKDVTSVKAEDKDITDKVVYEALGKYVPVVPVGFTPPTIQNPQYPNNNDDPSKPGDPTTTTTIPYVPGTTPVGPNGQPLTPKNPNNKEEGYLPPAPTTPTGDTTITYVKDGTQIAVTKFVDTTGKGLEPSVVDTGDTGKAFTKDADVTATINKILARGYEKVENKNGETPYPTEATARVFDADASTNQEYTVTFKPIIKDVPTDPNSEKPTPGQPVVPGDNNGPKWPESVKNLKTTDTVKRTIKYVYEDGKPVIDPATGAQKVVEQTVEFTRPAKVNLATGDITYGDWTPAKELAAVASPTAMDIPELANHIVSTETVPAVTVEAEAEDITETVIYRKVKPITVQPNDPTPTKDTPIDKDNPNGPKWTEELIKKLEDARKEEVTRTISYTYSTDEKELKEADAAKKGTNVADAFTNRVEFKRAVTIDPKNGEFTYGPWVATNDDTTLEGKAELPKVEGYIATGDVDSSKKDVTGVNATDKDITEKVVYKALGKYVPVVPEGFDKPNIDKPQYPNSDDPSKPGTPETVIPHVPGTTPVGPDGKPLTPKDPNDKTKGYLPPAPTDPTKDTSIIYVKDGSQIAVTKFVDTTGKGLEPSVVDSGDTGKAFTKDAEVTATINKILARGYEKVANVNAGEKDYPSTAAEKVFDADAKTNQEFTVTFKAKVVDIPSFDPTKPASNDNPKPTPGQPVDPTKPDGPKWPESVKDLKTTESVTRTIKYVYEDATPVGDDKLGTAVAGKKVQTLEFTRTAKVNLATGEIEYGKWTPKTTDGFEAVATPTIDGYTSALVNNPATSDVPAKTVTADAEDYEEVVIYKVKQTVIDPNDPNFDSDKPVNPKDPNGKKYKDLKLKEEVKRTITYTYADDVADATKRGTEAESKFETTVSFTRTATVNGATGEITYSEWAAKDNDTTLEGKAVVPVKTGYVATGDVEASKKDVTGVNATDKDIVEKVIYKDLGKFVPVVPEGFTPPTIENPQYPNNPKDPTKPGTPTTTIPYVPGTTPVGPNGKPLTPKDPNDPKQGYNPPAPTNPTEDTTIVYVKDGSQVAVTHFIEVNNATDKVEKGGVAQSIVDTGDTGKAFTKGAEVEKTIEALKAKGYTVVENNYPTDGKFDADATTNQEYKVLVTVKPVTVNPNDPAPTPGKPIDPNNPNGPKWTPDLIKELEDGRKDEVKRTIKYVYADGKEAATPVKETKEFTRSATINPVTGKITFGDWSPAQTFGEVTSPEIKNYTPDKATVPAKEVAAGADDVTETVIYTTKPVTLDPTKPTNPNTPNVTPKPEDKVPNDPKGRTYKELGLIEEVTHTVRYRLADGTDAGIEDNVQTLTFTRTADLDPVTGAISNYSDWKAKGDDTTIDAVPTPAKEGYVASAKASTERANVKATDKDSEETIIYRKLGSYVPVIPEGVTPPANTDLTPKPYPNDPKDPTKPGTPTETPVVPYIPGTTPIGPDGKPLTPKDPNDPTKGYEVPKQPADPTQDTRITYVKEGSQVALIHFVKADGTAVHVSVAEAGVTGQAIKTANVDKVKADLEAKGYEVVEPTDPAYTAEREAFYGEANRKYDDKDDKGAKGISQVYYVIVKEGITPIDPDKPLTPTTPDLPKPGDKVPGDPKQRTFEQLGLIEEVNRTINYRYANTDKVEEAKRGTEAAETVNQKLRYTRKGDLNKVTGEITYTSDWTKPQTLAEVVSPVIEGYVADIKAAEKVDNVAYNAADSTVNVVYSPLGKYVPKVPEGFEEPKLDKPQYPNDPKDPTKPGTPTTVIPHVPGTTPKDPNGNPLKPVDPNDPTKGYVPPAPENPTEDTTIVYEKDTQKAVTKFVDPTGKPIPGTVTIEESGKSGEPLTKANDVTAEIAKLIAKGYDLVSNNYGKDNDGNFDKDSSKDQEYTVVLTPHIQDVPPFDPKDPNDPKTPQPGQPIDPNNPTGPKWTDELIKQLETTRHVNRTIKYIDEKGNEVSKTVTDKVTFTRGAKLNVVTGEITYNEWTAKDNDTTFVRVVSPVVKGYILKDAKQEIVPASTGLTADSKDENIEVVYIKLGSWVPKVPGGETPIDPIPYPTDPNDPTKPGTDKPRVPYIPGTTPVVPKDPTKPISPDNPLVPLTPVDPNDPTKGYEVPPVPTDPRVDTPINYVTDKQKAITNFADENGKVVSTPVVDEGDSGANFNKDKVDEVTKTIEKLEKAGYRVVSNDFPSKDTDRVFDKDKSVDQIFNVKVAERIIPVTPGKPVDPNDPNLPKNPDGTPVTPSTPEPGKPVFPNDPNSPVWPSTVKDLVTEKSATRTIKYVDRNGKEVTETRVETIKFTRDAKINLVTGEITYGEWTTDRNDDIFNGYPVPVVKGYIAKDGDLESSTKDVKVTPDTIKDINETVVYDKLGSWVPNIPGTPTNPIPYPNDPKDPTKPGSDKPIVPYVPGHTPMVPQDPTKPVGPNNPLVPLKPVDPNDPTKGYEVPNVPNDPTKDTPISYVPVPQPTPKPTPAPTPETPKAPEEPVAPKAPTQVKRLANTGTTETNTGLAGLGMAIFGGLLAAVRRRKNNED
ncbi:CshA/CshB family fibrillar adhesin-related protein [Gemella sp. 20925_1_85]|uniref:mucin-binding protein n=1 Tax=Gemella sp. 20925_1_85 TaxID=3003690 RepID=UPI00352C5F6B